MPDPLRYRVHGMDCASCAAKVARAVEAAGVQGAELSLASGLMELPAPPPAPERLEAMEAAVRAAGYALEPLAPAAPPPQFGRGYARALWVVVVLNLGYGVIEALGGMLADSQALKADALDFIGDGMITLFGVVALGWSLGARARAAAAQGLFLAGLGVAVLAETLWRIWAGQALDPVLMGGFGAVALLVNLAAAAFLLPHRQGDANMRAVWLFSRNDAIGNAAVVAAALVAGWSGSRWPDLAVAFVMAALFLQAATAILRDARADLGRARNRA